MGKFEVFQSKGKWYFRLKAGNGEIVAASEAYNTKQGALKGVASVQKFASSSPVLIMDKDAQEVKPRELKKQLIKQEKDYADPKKEAVVKPEEEKQDEQKSLGPVGPRWM